MTAHCDVKAGHGGRHAQVSRGWDTCWRSDLDQVAPWFLRPGPLQAFTLPFSSRLEETTVVEL